MNLSTLSSKDFDKQFQKKLVTNLKDLEPWIREAYRRIENGEKVLGCKTKQQLCDWYIGRSTSHVRNLLSGTEQRRRPLETSDTRGGTKEVGESEPAPAEPAELAEDERDDSAVLLEKQLNVIKLGSGVSVERNGSCFNVTFHLLTQTDIDEIIAAFQNGICHD